jgi:class 3 adenylate cyclase
MTDAVVARSGGAGLAAAESGRESRPPPRYDADLPPPSGSSPRLRTILVTDLEQFTRTIHQLGDVRGRELMRKHNAILRACARAHQGVEVAHTGDGMIIAFDDAAQALRCAAAVQRAVAFYDLRSRRSDLRIRVGLHAGTPLEDEGRLFGLCVNTAVRVCGAADGSQIVVSRIVVELAGVGAEQLRCLGSRELKGVEQLLVLYELRWHSRALAWLN